MSTPENYTVLLTPRARKETRRLNRQTTVRIAAAIDSLASNPRRPGCLKVKTSEGLWRIRVGDWRIGYEIDDRSREVTIITVGHRREFTIERLFNERHSKFLELLPSLNETLDTVFKHSVMADREGLTVFMLGRRCVNDFSEILLLASNGYGFAALQILRSMFEKLVDARYLHDHPDEVDDFWDYHLILLVKLGYQDIAGKFDAEWTKKVAKFKTSGRRGTRTRSRWTKLSLVDEAKKVGLEGYLHGAYYLPNAFIHNSAAEILFALKADANGRFTPLDFSNPDERRMADVSIHQGLVLLIETLNLQIQHYGWEDSELTVQPFLDLCGTYMKSISATKSKI